MSEQHQVRLHKRTQLAEPYPASVPRTNTLPMLRAAHEGREADSWSGEHVSITGRISSLRNSGKLCFATLEEDQSHFQVMLDLEHTGADALREWKEVVDLGDLVSVSGEVGASRRGELTVLATSWMMASKSLHAMPSKLEGITDPEARRRQRYLELISSSGAQRTFQVRASVLRSLRETLWDRGFQEATTPVLTGELDGSAARQFSTHSHALSQELHLRIALELHLKRLLVGGVSRVFELGPCFRNEGSDRTHSPEFTMLEAYEAYGDYHSCRETVRELIVQAALAANGHTRITVGEVELDLSAEWRVASLHELVSEALGAAVTPASTLAELTQLAGVHQVQVTGSTPGEVVVELYERLVEETLIAPTFVCDYPQEARPLARAHRSIPGLTESWDLVIGGMEIAPAYSELVDPVVQRERLVAQAQASGGSVDEEFLLALEHGCPPAGGFGLGVDRLVMLLSGESSIRDAITFPMMRQQ